MHGKRKQTTEFPLIVQPVGSQLWSELQPARPATAPKESRFRAAKSNVKSLHGLSSLDWESKGPSIILAHGRVDTSAGSGPV